jgi:hypothetical protein
VRACVTAGGGFLLAVLWFDLMFDVQVRGHRGRDLPESVLASIAGYYARVTTAASPMNRLVALVMLATLTALGVQAGRGDDPAWAARVSLALVAVAVGVAASHTVRSAVRLGTRSDSPQVQSALARSVLRDHLVCFGAISAMLAVQLLAT